MKIKSIDQEQVRSAVLDYAARLRSTHSEIEQIIWFGSWINGIPHPYSDVDLCIIISHSEKRRHERVVEYFPPGFPTGIDLIVVTNLEFETMREESSGLYRAIISGKEI